MAALLTASRKYPAAPRALHACAESVRLSPTPFARLIGALWQSNPPSLISTISPRNVRARSYSEPRRNAFIPESDYGHHAFTGRVSVPLRIS